MLWVNLASVRHQKCMYLTRHHLSQALVSATNVTLPKINCSKFAQLFRLQPSFNLHAQLQPLYSAALVPNVLPRREARIRPVQWSKPHSISAPTQDSNLGGRIQNHKRWPLHYQYTPVTTTLRVPNWRHRRIGARHAIVDLLMVDG